MFFFAFVLFLLLKEGLIEDLTRETTNGQGTRKSEL